MLGTFSVDGKPIRGGRKEYEAMAEALIQSGMRDAGYTLISTVCTGWVGRDPVTHELQENTTLWPGGMKALLPTFMTRACSCQYIRTLAQTTAAKNQGPLVTRALT